MSITVMDAPTLASPTLSSLARENLLLSDGDVREATDSVIARLRAEPDLLAAVSQRAVEMAASEYVSHAMRNERQAIFAGATPRTNLPGSAPQTKTGVAALANGLTRALLDFPLSGGQPLREATREDVETQARLYGTAARNMRTKAIWLSAIAEKVPEGVTVGEALTEDDAEALLKEARNVE